MIGVTRGISTLAGAAVAGVLLWIATQIGTESNGEYWATYGVIAAAGLTMALSQLLGGWTKWGWPRVSRTCSSSPSCPYWSPAAGCCLRASPPTGRTRRNWSHDLGIYGAVADLVHVLPAIAFGIGLVFGFTFDTTGPRREPVAVPTQAQADDVKRVERDADEPLAAERRPYAYADSTDAADDHDGATGRSRRRLAHLAAAIPPCKRTNRKIAPAATRDRISEVAPETPSEASRAEQEEEEDRPEKRLLSLVDRRHAQMHRRRS